MPVTPAWGPSSGLMEAIKQMWFLPRVSGLVVLAVIGASLLLLATDFEVKGIIAIAGGIVFVVMFLGVVFDLWEPKK